ncbi:MAG: pilus assembly protein TadG-related protein [Candidatus Dormibacteria bacterium]|jgi:Flp pilus assembly protein TadG
MLSRRQSRIREHGQILVMFAFSMLFLIVGMIAVAVDLSQLYEAHVRAQDAAEQAAAAGASQVDYVAAESSVASLLPSFASVCSGAGDAFSGVVGSTTCTSPEGTDDVVASVTVRASVALPLPFLGGTFTIATTSTAAPVVGGLAPVG